MVLTHLASINQFSGHKISFFLKLRTEVTIRSYSNFLFKAKANRTQESKMSFED